MPPSFRCRFLDRSMIRKNFGLVLSEIVSMSASSIGVKAATDLPSLVTTTAFSDSAAKSARLRCTTSILIIFMAQSCRRSMRKGLFQCYAAAVLRYFASSSKPMVHNSPECHHSPLLLVEEVFEETRFIQWRRI